jgi:hypothetical protein
VHTHVRACARQRAFVTNQPAARVSQRSAGVPLEQDAAVAELGRPGLIDAGPANGLLPLLLQSGPGDRETHTEDAMTSTAAAQLCRGPLHHLSTTHFPPPTHRCSWSAMRACSFWT